MKKWLPAALALAVVALLAFAGLEDDPGAVLWDQLATQEHPCCLEAGRAMAQK